MITDLNRETPPINYGVLVFPTFQALDAFGPLDALNIISSQFPMNLYIIAATLDPVSTKPRPASTTSNFGQSIVPTHTFATAPPLDVLIIPGGFGTRADDLDPLIDYVRNTYPGLKYIFTVCTGAWLAARAGVLDGKRATTNKLAWDGTKKFETVNWVPHARWVVDGNVWTCSGVSAGIDGMLALIQECYGKKVAESTAITMEYEWHQDSTKDPFAERLGM